MTALTSMLPDFQGELYTERRGNHYATSAALAYVLRSEGYKGITEQVVWNWRQMPGFPESGDVTTEGRILEHAEFVKRWAIDEGLLK